MAILNIMQVFFLGVLGLFFSMISYSGTWIIIFSMILYKLMDPSNLITWTPIIIFTIISIIVEIFELYSGKIGVAKYGGSKKAQFAALICGLLGGVFGGFLIPIPIIGNIIGMMLITFIVVYFIEYNRLDCKTTALKISWGSVVAKSIVMFIKFFVTLGFLIYYISTVFKLES